MGKRIYFYDIAAKIKECAKCRLILPFDDFTIDRVRKDGRKMVCRGCISPLGKDGCRPTPLGVFDSDKRMRECTACKKVLPFEDFSKAHKRARYRGGISCRCKKCEKLYRRNDQLRRNYGLTIEQHDAMLEAQGGLCLICKDSMSKPHVDHCHATGRVRGLLCKNCNLGLGAFKDRPESLERAIAYLKNLT